MWTLDPLSIATGGYIGIAPTGTAKCPLPLAIGTDGYVRIRRSSILAGDGGGGGVRHRLHERQRPQKAPDDSDDVELMLAVAAFIIEEDL